MAMKIYLGRNSCRRTCKRRANNSQEEANNHHQGQAQPDKDKHPDKDNHRHRDSNSRECPTCRP